MLSKNSRLVLSLLVGVVVYFALYKLLSRKMESTTSLVVSLVIALVVAGIMMKTIKVKEGYAEVMIAPTYDPFFYSDPGFRAQLPPRFDSNRMGGGMIKSSFPGFDKQGAGITPLSDNENCDGSVIKEGYNDMNNGNNSNNSYNNNSNYNNNMNGGNNGNNMNGGNNSYNNNSNYNYNSNNGNNEYFNDMNGEDIDKADCNNGPSAGDKAGDFSSLGLMDSGISKYKKGCNAVKEDAVMKFKSAQGYADPEQLLPVPDIKNCLVDPSDPENYMYDRTLFAPLKRRNGYVQTDFIRGDLYIPSVNSGWFYAPTIPSVDLQKGALNILNSSIDNQDIVYSNSKPIVAPTEEEQLDIWKADPVNKMQNPWANQVLHRE